MIKVGFIEYFLDEFHAQKYPGWLSDASHGEVKVCYAYAMQDSPNGRTSRQFCDEYGLELCDSIEEVVAKSDCLIVLSPDNPEFHEMLCQLPLASGKRVYVDKTFAPDGDTAKRIINNAKTHATPFFSSSALRFSKEYKDISKEGIEFIAARGPGRMENYLIHHVEPVVALMGTEIEKMMYIGASETPSFVFKFSHGRYATISMLGWESDFGMAINYQENKAVVIEHATDFFEEFIRNLIDFFKTGDRKVDSDETQKIMTILEYAHKAKADPDTWLLLPQ